MSALLSLDNVSVAYDKAEAVRRAFVDPPSRQAPGSLIAPESGSLTVILDEAAAAQIPAPAREGG